MTYDELVITLSQQTRYTQREIKQFMKLLSSHIKRAMTEGRDVHLYGIGRFVCKLDGIRYGRNKFTGMKIVIAPRRRLRFVPSDILKKAALKAPLFEEDLAAHFGLKKGKTDGKVRRSDRPGKGSQGEEGRSRG